jgi:hypothetical protein
VAKLGRVRASTKIVELIQSKTSYSKNLERNQIIQLRERPYLKREIRKLLFLRLIITI